MPLGPGVRYRWKKYSSGRKVRLAFRGRKVVEAMSMKEVLANNIRKRKSRRKRHY